MKLPAGILLLATLCLPASAGFAWKPAVACDGEVCTMSKKDHDSLKRWVSEVFKANVATIEEMQIQEAQLAELRRQVLRIGTNCNTI